MVDTKRTNFEVEGVGVFNSVEEMAEASGCSVEKILTRRGKGATDKEIYYNIPMGYRIFNREFTNLYDFRREFSLKLKNVTIKKKLSKGASLEEVIIESIKGVKPEYYTVSTKGIKVTLEGKEYPSIASAYEAYKDDERVTEVYHTIRKRIEAYRWKDEKAFFTSNQKRKVA
jgi:hypothetical protein